MHLARAWERYWQAGMGCKDGLLPTQNRESCLVKKGRWPGDVQSFIPPLCENITKSFPVLPKAIEHIFHLKLVEGNAILNLIEMRKARLIRLQVENSFLSGSSLDSDLYPPQA